jgi:hypothetical protein
MDGYFGLCPVCRKTDGFVNVHSSHLFICKEHKKYWLVGSNLFSCWKDQTEAEQRKIWREAELEDFEDISGHAFTRPCRTSTPSSTPRNSRRVSSDRAAPRLRRDPTGGDRP